MKKLLLVVLACMALAGASRAEDIPAGVIPPGESILTLAVRMARRVPGRLAGRVLGNLVAKGMTVEQVEQILGTPDFRFGGRGCFTNCYNGLGISVDFTFEVDAAGTCHVVTSSIAYPPLFD